MRFDTGVTAQNFQEPDAVNDAGGSGDADNEPRHIRNLRLNTSSRVLS
jgi:hypothetical protein